MSLLRRLNDLPIFDPSRIPGREAIARVLGCLAVTAFLARRVLQLPGWPGYIAEIRWAKAYFARLSFLPPFLQAPAFDLDRWYGQFGYSHSQIRTLWISQLLIWIVETLILLAYILALLTRREARSVAKGFMQTLFPLILAGLPFVIVMTDYTYDRWFPESSRMHLTGLYAMGVLLIGAGTTNVIGLLILRPAFTIMSEARVFIRSGLYRVVRHPLYASHFVIYFCYTLLHCHVVTVAIYAAFLVGQTLRARIEERKLAEVFPDYEEYRRTTGMFFPKLWGRG